MKMMLAHRRWTPPQGRVLLLSGLALLLAALTLWPTGFSWPHTAPAALATLAVICLIGGLLTALVERDAGTTASSFYTLAALSLVATLLWTWGAVLVYLLALLPGLGLVYLLTLVGLIVQGWLLPGTRRTIWAGIGISALPVVLVAGCYLLLGTALGATIQEVRLAMAIGIAVTYFNLTAVIFSGGPALDAGIRLPDGRRLLGQGKTWRGSLAGLLMATLAFFAFGGGGVGLGLLIGVTTFLGDAGASFWKRRMGQEPGAPVPLLDQWDGLLPLLILIGFWTTLAIWQPLIPLLLAATLFVQLFGNRALYQLGKKSVPW